jgi:cyclophilin family peptidyl-prolyl cis-trans isomerase
MRLKSSRRRRSIIAPAHAAPVVTPLEPRCLMSTVSLSTTEATVKQLPNILSTDTANQSFTLDNYIQDPNVPGTIATFNTSKGPIVVALTDPYTPATVANFLSYVNSGEYNDTIFHRSAYFGGDDTTGLGVGGSPSNPGNIIQGGGYALASDGLDHIATSASPPDEYTTEEFGNLEGTLVMANTGSADTESSEFFFNNTDNTSTFASATAPYTVFGHVLSGESTVTTIASLNTSATSSGSGTQIALNTTVDGQVQSDTSSPVPLTGLTAYQISRNYAVQPNDLVYTYSITTAPGTNYTATSSDPSLVTPVVSSDGVLTFKYGTAAAGGTAVITVTGTTPYDNNTTASETFVVTVPSTTVTTSTPVATADTVANVVTGVATVIQPLTNDTVGSTDNGALDQASVAIITQPTNGTATINANTGEITYTSTTNFTGTDSFTYTVHDVAGQSSAVTTVTLDVVPTPINFTMGAGNKIKVVNFTQADGARGRLTITGGTAKVTFTAGNGTGTSSGGTETVTGASIASIVVANIGKAKPALSVTRIGSKGTVTLGDVDDQDALSVLNAPNVTLTGTVTAKSIKQIILGASDGGSISASSDNSVATVASIGTAVNTSLTLAALTSLTSKSWTVTDDGAEAVSAAAIDKLTVTSAFADNLILTGNSGFALTTANVNNPSGKWDITGVIHKATVSKPTSAFALSDESEIETLIVKGDLQGSVVGAVIGNMTVTGGAKDAVIETDANFNAADTQLVKLSIAGAVTGSTIVSSGNIGSITAKSLTASQIYAGASNSTIGGDVLPTTVDQLSADANIKSVSLTAGKDTFSSSEIAAYTIGNVGLGQVTTDNGGTGFGVSAHTITALSARLNPGGGLFLTKAQTKTAAILSAYLTKHKKTLKDFIVQVY